MPGLSLSGGGYRAATTYTAEPFQALFNPPVELASFRQRRDRLVRGRCDHCNEGPARRAKQAIETRPGLSDPDA